MECTVYSKQKVTEEQPTADRCLTTEIGKLTDTYSDMM